MVQYSKSLSITMTRQMEREVNEEKTSTNFIKLKSGTRHARFLVSMVICEEIDYVLLPQCLIPVLIFPITIHIPSLAGTSLQCSGSHWTRVR